MWLYLSFNCSCFYYDKKPDNLKAKKASNSNSIYFKKSEMENRTSPSWVSQRYNIISPMAHGSEETTNFSTIENIEDHLILYTFLIDWNAVFVNNWLQVLLTRGCYDNNPVNIAHNKWHMNPSEKILIH